jgi:sec-independent protein translocase protein TatC
MAPPPEETPSDLPTMSFGEHLEELRRRVIHALLGLGVALCVTLYYGRPLIAFIYAPLAEVQRAADLPTQTYTRSVLSGFTVYMKVSLVAGLILASPWVMYQIWKFISAGLYPAERRAARILVGLSSLMTGVGLAFMYYLFLPAALAFLVQFTTSYPINAPEDHGFLRQVTHMFFRMNENTLLPGSKMPPPSTVAATTTGTQPTTMPAVAPAVVPVCDQDPPTPVEGQIWFNRTLNEMRIYQGQRVRVVTLTSPSAMVPLIDPADYINEVAWMALTIVVVFHVPVVMAFLGMVGLGNAAWLAKRRKLIVFLLFVFAVFLTPSQDLFSNLALPLLGWALFEFGLVLMRFFERRHRRAALGD